MEAHSNPLAENSRKNVLVYGCYGYTGRLIVEEGQRRKLPMVLSGRDAAKTKALAEKHGLPWIAADLNDPAALDQAMAGCAVVLHCAGPYVHTWQKMAAACIRNGVHYLDITGEIVVFEGLFGMDEAARKAGVQFMPGVGFDVVPTDCLAARLHARMPAAVRLDLAILNAGGGSSHGTALTMVEGMGYPGMARRNGKIVPRPMAADDIMADFGRGPRKAVSIPWGDVSTAFHSTGIPNITTYFALPPKVARMLRWSNALGWLLRMPWVKRKMRNRILKGAAGPTAEVRARSRTLVWGSVADPQGQTITDLIEVPNGYTFTALSAVHIALLVLAGKYKLGFQTPSMAYQSGLLEEILDEAPV